MSLLCRDLFDCTLQNFDFLLSLGLQSRLRLVLLDEFSLQLPQVLELALRRIQLFFQ